MTGNTATLSSESTIINEDVGYIGRIPVRNLWLLMLYASDLYRQVNHAEKVSVEENPDEIANLVAAILSQQVEQRIKRNLSFGFQMREASLNRVRGRIDIMKTECEGLLDKGKVFCRFDELTINTPQNCYVRSALEVLIKIVNKPALKHKCRSIANSLKRMGVVGEKPNYSEVSVNRFGRHDLIDKKMLTVAHLAFNLALPTESAGEKYLSLPNREITWVRKLYEKGIAGFYAVNLFEHGWCVEAGKRIYWLIDKKSEGIDAILPSMQTDIVLTHKSTGRRIIIDTKFNSIVTKGWHRDKTIRSAYMYQIYAYLKSQEKIDDHLANNASGILLHPSIENNVDESVVIQGHNIRFTTVDLSAEAKQIQTQLLQIIEER